MGKKVTGTRGNRQPRAPRGGPPDAMTDSISNNDGRLPQSVNILLQAYGGAAFGYADEGFPADMLRSMFVAGSDAVLRVLAARAESEFPAALPMIKQLITDTAEVDHCLMTPEEIHKLPGADTPAPRRPRWWNSLRHG